MSATDELRKLLDERGVKWTAVGKDITLDNQTYCYPHTFTEFQDGLVVTNLTPEQAIAATLGAETCTIGDYKDPDYGYTHDAMWNDEWFVPVLKYLLHGR